MLWCLLFKRIHLRIRTSAELVQSESASALPQKEENSLSELLRLVKVQTRKLEEQQKLQQEQQKKIDNLSNQLFQRRPFKARSYSYYGRTPEQIAESRLKTEDYNRFHVSPVVVEAIKLSNVLAIQVMTVR